MFILKLIGKVCVLPVIIVLAILLGIVKVCVGIYNFARALFGLLIGALVILTVIFYQDWLQMRWGIETSFRELKYAVGLTSFHSKKREYITQEIWARLILYNFCEIITAHVVINKCTQKHVYQVNYTFAIHICRYFISKMAEKSPPDVEALIRKEILPVRPGRHDPRKVDHKKAVSFLYRVA